MSYELSDFTFDRRIRGDFKPEDIAKIEDLLGDISTRNYFEVVDYKEEASRVATREDLASRFNTKYLTEYLIDDIPTYVVTHADFVCFYKYEKKQISRRKIESAWGVLDKHLTMLHSNQSELGISSCLDCTLVPVFYNTPSSHSPSEFSGRLSLFGITPDSLDDNASKLDELSAGSRPITRNKQKINILPVHTIRLFTDGIRLEV